MPSKNDTSFEQELKIVNQRLKDRKLGVTIRQRGNRLYVRAIFPPKPNSQKTDDYQQDIALGFKAQKAGLRSAEKKAADISFELAGKTFDWSNYLIRPIKSNADKTVAEWSAELETHYFQKRARNSKSETTWKNHYRLYLRRLPQDEVITPELLKQVILQTPADSCTRSQMCFAYKALGDYIGLDVAFIADLKGSYNSLKPARRDLPNDEEIQAAILQIPNPAWRWMAGMQATYGLRPHELFHLDISDLEQGNDWIKVGPNTKTGERTAIPLHREWIDLFNLRHPKMPGVQIAGKPNQSLGDSVSKAFRRYHLPFCPYDLRHCWAVRALRYNLPVAVSARWMGHSVDMHTTIYQAWITEQMERDIYERAINPQSSLAPTVSSALNYPAAIPKEPQGAILHNGTALVEQPGNTAVAADQTSQLPTEANSQRLVTPDAVTTHPEPQNNIVLWRDPTTNPALWAKTFSSQVSSEPKSLS